MPRKGYVPKNRMAINIDPRSFESFDKADELLSKLPIEIDKHKIIRNALQAVGKVVTKEAKQRVIRGKNRRSGKHLWQTITYDVRKINQGYSLKVGAGYPAGAHAHLIEFGHEVKSRGPNRKGQPPLTGVEQVEAKRWLAPAVDVTQQQQDQTFIETVKHGIQQAGG